MQLRMCQLEDVASIEISNVDKKIKSGEVKVRLCNFTDVYYNWSVFSEMEESFLIASATDTQRKKFKLKTGQVAITKDSETREDIGISTYIVDDFKETLLGYHCALITPNPSLLNGSFLNGYLNSKVAKKYFFNNATGSGMRFSLSLDVIRRIPLFLPPIEIQNTVGHFFSLIEQKISICRKINRNLPLSA